MGTKMTKIYDYDHQTGQSVLRDATTEEVLELKTVSENLAELKNQESLQSEAKKAVLDKLGLTAEELAALL